MRTWLCATLLLVFSSALAAEPMPARLGARFDAIHAASNAQAMVAAVIDGEHTYITGTNANGQSLLRINSLTKAMTGEVLATLIAEGRVKLDDQLKLYAPPTWRGTRVTNTITLRDLAAHVSGLPRDMPPGLSRQGRWTWLARQKVPTPSGRVAQYSNAAYMILGDVLSNAAGESYEALLKRTVTTPLALADTTLNPTPAQCARLLPTAHPCASTYAIDAMGGLYSTADDMARWMRAELNAGPGTPRAVAQNPIVKRGALTRVVNLDMAGPMDAIAMGWLRMHLGMTPVLQKTGGGGGFMNYVILAPTERKALFVTVNRVDIPMLRNLAAQANTLMSEELLH